jgi:hypothetical protein
MTETHDKHSLLMASINDGLPSSSDPIRKGVPKGDRYGMSRKKELSTRIFSTNLKVKEVADAIETSYGLVRDWRTEPYYLDRIKSHRRKLAEKIVHTNNPDFSRFSDISIYGQELMEDIWALTKRHAVKIHTEKEFERFVVNIIFLFAMRKNCTLPIEINVRTAIFDLAEVLSQPWEADKSTVENAKEEFIKQIKELL